MTHRVAVIAGDGAGPEVVAEARKCVDALALDLTWDELPNRLIAQMRERLLSTAEPFAPDQVAAERAHALAIRTSTSDLSDEERLLAPVSHLRQIVAWAEQNPV